MRYETVAVVGTGLRVPGGAMLAVGLDEAALQWLDGVAVAGIAAVNDRSSVTLAGDSAALERLARALADAGVFAEPLRVEVPYHSPAMDPILDAVVRELEPITPQPPLVPVYSTVTGSETVASDWAAAYWGRNIRETVRFAATVERALADGSNCFIEVSPHPVLSTNLLDLAAGRPTVVVSLLNRRRRRARDLPRCARRPGDRAGRTPAPDELGPVPG